MNFKNIITASLIVTAGLTSFAQNQQVGLKTDKKIIPLEEIQCVRQIGSMKCVTYGSSTFIKNESDEITYCSSTVYLQMKNQQVQEFEVKTQNRSDNDNVAWPFLALINVGTGGLFSIGETKLRMEATKANGPEKLHKELDRLSADLTSQGVVACADFKDLTSNVSYTEHLEVKAH